MMGTLIWVLFAYCIGGIPFGLLLSKKLTGVDLRTHGSCNIGATNAFRTGNKFLGIATFLCDFFKGALPVFCAQHYELADPYIIGSACVLGHVISVWLLLFSNRSVWGGKGVATALGTMLAIDPMLFLFVALIWVCAFFIVKISAFSALISFIFAPFLSIFCLKNDLFQASYLAFLAILITVTHRKNIKIIWETVKQKK